MVRKNLSKNRKLTKIEIMQKAENSWWNMTSRTKTESYKHCTICDEWKDNKQVHKLWYEQNFYEVQDYNGKLADADVNVDKDLLQFRAVTKVYSPDTCIMLPKSINLLVKKLESRVFEIIETSEGDYIPTYKQNNSTNARSVTMLPACNTYHDALINLCADWNQQVMYETIKFYFKIPMYVIQKVNEVLLINLEGTEQEMKEKLNIE